MPQFRAASSEGEPQRRPPRRGFRRGPRSPPRSPPGRDDADSAGPRSPNSFLASSSKKSSKEADVPESPAVLSFRSEGEGRPAVLAPDASWPFPLDPPSPPPVAPSAPTRLSE